MKSPEDQGLLIDDAAPGVRVITLDRPQRLNALDGPTLQALTAAVRECDAASVDKRVIVLRGSGRAFCSGSDLKWLAESGVIDDPAAHLRNQDRMAAAFEAIESSRCIVIASVQGFAVAGGLELALACDLIVVAEDAQLGDEHLRKDLLPSGGSSQRLPRRIGLSRALYYLVSGRMMSGIEAERIGLACVAVPAELLERESLHLADDIARADAHALAAIKALARRALELPLRDGLQLERWQQFRYRNESPALLHSVRQFAAGSSTASTDEAPR